MGYVILLDVNVTCASWIAVVFLADKLSYMVEGQLSTEMVTCGVCMMFAAAVLAAPRADRLAKVDAEGVMRWTDDGSEVALFGVNYYPPFTVDYKLIKENGLDFSQVMREDVAHFRRLGLTCIRIHCFDRQFSTHDGAFLSNHHVALLDELIDLCAKNGIYTVLTPIAWWGGAYAEDKEGFSNDWTMQEMTSNRAAWPIQVRFLKEFGQHVNAVTGLRYADDPAILCFELINEPLYPPNHPDEEVTAYINALADGLRASGTTKPIFYNSWQERNAAAGRARIDGVTGSTYPTGLVSGHALSGIQLSKVGGSSLYPDEYIARKARMIYEFDCADTPGAYMYPAFAKVFRHEGVQVAAQFQYDPMCLADVNSNWQTHHLNLIYTPAKALAFAIAAEAFRRLPRGCDYTNAVNEIVFPPFRINAERNLSQMSTETDYLYTADPIDPPPAPEKLRRVWGVGKSPVAASTGNGIYFLDKAADGVWSLQLYPSVFTVRDEYSGGTRLKVTVLPESSILTVNLPDLGTTFRVRAAGNGTVVAQSREGCVTLAPGDYVLENVSEFNAAARAALAALDTPPFHTRTAPERVCGWRLDNVPNQWGDRKPLSLNLSEVGATNIVVTVQSANGSETRVFPIRLCAKPDDWEFFDVTKALQAWTEGWPEVKKLKSSDPQGRPALRLTAEAGAFVNRAYSGLRFDCDYEGFKNIFGETGPGKTVIFRARATDEFTKQVEVVFIHRNGGNWGVDLSLTPEWQTIRVPLEKFHPYWRTRRGDGTAPDMSQIRGISTGYGRWLYGDTLDKPHGYELSSIMVEF